MFIKSQNGMNLINTNKVIRFTAEIGEHHSYIKAVFNDNYGLIIGEYHNEKDVDIVMDDILLAINEKRTYLMPGIDDV